jgi:hypothetical protein
MSDQVEQTGTTIRTHRREPGILGELNSGAKRIAKSLANTTDQMVQAIEHTMTGAGYSAKTYRVEAAEDYAMTRATASQNLQSCGYTPEEIAQLFGQLV